MPSRLLLCTTVIVATLAVAGCKTWPTAPVNRAAIAATTPDPSAAGRTAAAEKPVCHNEVVTGSLMSVRVCETQAQREAREAATRDAKDKLTRPAAASCGPHVGLACTSGG